ncbi:MAG: glycosyl hydrolase family protein [Alphaproteobacteria bacterium]|nr:glycosyl hydrolase family protein [Alphaproteobacteria bacterium]
MIKENTSWHESVKMTPSCVTGCFYHGFFRIFGMEQVSLSPVRLPDNRRPQELQINIMDCDQCRLNPLLADRKMFEERDQGITLNGTFHESKRMKPRIHINQKHFAAIVWMMMFAVTATPGQTPTGWPGCVTTWPTVQLTATDCYTGTWNLVLDEGFTGQSLNTTIWVPRTPWGDPPDHSTYNLPANIVLQDGNASLKVKSQPGSYPVPWCSTSPTMKWYDWTGAEMWTWDRYQYGRFEIKCTIPRGVGYWPAFWLYSTTISHAEEIDIFEFWNEWILYWWNWINWDYMSRNQHMSVHHCNWEEATENLGWEFWNGSWIFALEWDPFTVRWLVKEAGAASENLLREDYHYYDALTGNPLYSCDGIIANRSYRVNTTFPTIPMKVIASFKMGWDEMGTNNSTPSEGSLVVDYIRVYEKKHCNYVINQRAMGDLMNYPTTVKAQQILVGSADGSCTTEIQGLDFNFIASNRIVLKPNVHIKPAILFHVCGNIRRYSYFRAKIEPCDPNVIPAIQLDQAGSAEMLQIADTASSILAYHNSDQSTESELQYQVFPNPTDGHVNVVFSRQVAVHHVMVYNNLGMLISELDNPGNLQQLKVSVSEIPGIYLLVLHTGGSSVIRCTVVVR